MTNNPYNFKITDDFWSRYQTLVCEIMLPYQYTVLNDSTNDPNTEKSHALQNFRIAAGEAEGEFYGMVFQDSDVAKWLEAVAYSLAIKPNKELEKQADDVIALIGRAQEADGYLNTFYTIKQPQLKWLNLQEDHELYCAGHMIEAGVAYYQATGKTTLLNIVKKKADLIYSIFGKNKRTGVPGHPEIELALVRLYRATNDKRYLELANYFIDERGQNPQFFAEEKDKRNWTRWNMNAKNTDYSQMTHPVRKEKDAVGHAVRAVYLYTGMAMAAAETGDQTLLTACKTMWNSIVNKRMYITGGIGSTTHGEAFTMDYDLPNDTAYNETCASIALVFFAAEMLKLTNDGKYADVMERALYNTVLSGIQLDGTRFFYTNPLDFNPKYAEKVPNLRHIKSQRPKWYSCACCPPNAARLITSINHYAWHTNDNTVFSNLFIGGKYEDNNITINTETKYPYDNTITYKIVRIENGTKLAIHAPAWSLKNSIYINGKIYQPEIENGYIYIDYLNNNDVVSYTFDNTPKKVYSSHNVNANLGKCAIIAGPLTYCFEDNDNNNINAISINANSTPYFCNFESKELGSIQAVKIDGTILPDPTDLYSLNAPQGSPYTLTAIPYYAWGNRQMCKMKVWMVEK